MSEIIHPLRAYRDRVGLSLDEFARLVGDTTRQSLFRIEKGQQAPSLDLIHRITKATNGEVTADELVAAKKSFDERKSTAAA